MLAQGQREKGKDKHMKEPHNQLTKIISSVKTGINTRTMARESTLLKERL
jgi:uncharacterized protein YdcH (DUF465 family)